MKRDLTMSEIHISPVNSAGSGILQEFFSSHHQSNDVQLIGNDNWSKLNANFFFFILLSEHRFALFSSWLHFVVWAMPSIFIMDFLQDCREWRMKDESILKAIIFILAYIQ